MSVSRNIIDNLSIILHNIYNDIQLNMGRFLLYTHMSTGCERFVHPNCVVVEILLHLDLHCKRMGDDLPDVRIKLCALHP